MFQELQSSLTDVYFKPEYVSLYESDTDSAECFIYRSGGELYLLPYLKRKNKIGDDEFYDFETAYGYGGPISSSRDLGFLEEAECALSRACCANGIIAGFVRFSPWLSNHELVVDCDSLLLDRKTVSMDLAVDESDIWTSQIHSKHRNVIRKAEREGLVFEVDEGFSSLDEFIRLYRGTMERLGANDFYFFSDAHLRALSDSLGSQAFLGLIRNEGKVVSAAIFLHNGIYGHYHLSGSDPAYQNLASNNLMLYKAALHLKSLGVSRFHLGGGNNASPDNSLLKFKRRFSTDCLDFYIGKFIFDPQIYSRVCSHWEQSFPEKKVQYKDLLLKYRY